MIDDGRLSTAMLQLEDGGRCSGMGLAACDEPWELDRPRDMILLSDPYAVTLPLPDATEAALLPPASLSLLDDASVTVVNVLSKPVVRIARPACLVLSGLISP